MEKIYSPDVPIMSLMVLLSKTKFSSRSLKFRVDDHRNQRWDLPKKEKQNHSEPFLCESG